MLKLLGFFLIAAILIVASWWWRGVPVAMPLAPLETGQKLHCVSYAPFRGAQTPLDPTTVIPPSQIEEDLAHLARITDCVRIYSVDLGLDRVPEIAERHGLKVLLGIWISSEAKRNELQIGTGVALANRYPGTIRGVVVGNEVLLRGEMTAEHLRGLIRSVGAQVRVPVTYADVWEFWIRNRQLAEVVDLVTVHILPYWEDLPIPAGEAARHIASIQAQVAAVFPGKDVLVGEAGWPSAGRMREGALPSRANQARVIHDLLALARDAKFNVNIIEAFDQAWKRHLEGTVGGYWGVFTEARTVKFAWGEPVSNHPLWRWQAIMGLFLAALVIGAAVRLGRLGGQLGLGTREEISITVIAATIGVFGGAAVEAAAYESLGAGGWMRSTLLILVALASPVVAAIAISGRVLPVAMSGIIGRASDRTHDGIALTMGLVTMLTVVLAVESALGLVFNPRYLDFPCAALTSAILPLLLVSLCSRRPLGLPPAAEAAFAVLLVLCPLKIVWFETLANWQAVWLCAAFLTLAVTLARARAVRG